MASNVDYTVDFRGAIASIALLRMTDTFRGMQINQTLEILVDNQDTIKDIFKVLPSSAYVLYNMETIQEATAAYRIKIMKSAFHEMHEEK